LPMLASLLVRRSAYLDESNGLRRGHTCFSTRCEKGAQYTIIFLALHFG
jgi:hypothetical protein